MNPRVIAVVSLATLGAVGVVFLLAPAALTRYEEPKYELSQKDGDIELRKYPELIAAQVTVDGSGKDAANDAFKILSGYIFGNNKPREKLAMTLPLAQRTQSEKIAMTVPVVEQRESSKMTMQFFMPGKYDLDSLPEANDPRIKFVKVPAAVYAVIRFSGSWKEPNIRSHADELRNFLKSRNLIQAGEALRAYYNPPWTPLFMRRNEIWIPVQE